MIKAIIGLGNPGTQYAKTRHNAGFSLLDHLSKKYKAQFRQEKKFFADYTQLKIETYKLHALKPQTYMNRSGMSVAAFCRFYRLSAQDLLIVHDELDLPEGTVRLKFSGGHGGHNGLRDIIAACGSKDFYRLRLGIGRPTDKSQVIDFVLRRPSAEGRVLLSQAEERFIQVLPTLLHHGAERAMNELNTRNNHGI